MKEDGGCSENERSPFMFRWCSYCQSFIGESEPRDDFRLTHGVCRGCKPKVRTFSQTDMQGIEPIRHFFHDLQASVMAKQKFDKSKILADSKKLGINPADLLAGVMQPLLYEIGRMYQEGKIPAVQEHQFSLMIRELIRDIQMNLVLDSADNHQVDVLLACVNGNYHEFGISLLDLHLRQAGLKVESLCPGIPADQLVSYAKQLNAKVIGLSVSMENQLLDVGDVARVLSREPDYQPDLIAGGFVIRATTPPIPGVTLFSGSIEELVDWMAHKVQESKQLQRFA
jgi:methanogenic corrinoid protein MtbC1